MSFSDQHRQWKEVLFGGVNINNCAQSVHKIFKDMPPLIEVQRSPMAIGGAATIRNKEMVENVHCN